jgi:lipoate-protein ligase B
MRVTEDIMEWQRLGVLPYREAWALQEELREARRQERIPDRLLLLAHPPVITLGRRACEADLLASEEALAAEGIEVVKSSRGGRATYHGPGQLVGYFICGLRKLGLGVAAFVETVEEMCRGALAEVGVRCARDARHPGLWVGREKIVAIGLSVSNGITEHGFALNVDCDLAAYRHIVACGLADRSITSVAKLVPDPPSMAEMERLIVAQAARVFCRTMALRDETQVKVSLPALASASALGSS